MATIPVIVKHQGKTYPVDVDTTAPGEVFKSQLFSVTGVEPDRQKILVKGGQLKDDTDMGKLNLKPKQVLMMLGTPSGAGGDLVRPTTKVKFVEDMTDAEIAQQDGATPAGLQNLGNTCYLNSTLQTMKSIPELQEALIKYDGSSGGSSAGGSGGFDISQFSMMVGGGPVASGDLVKDLKLLFEQMGKTQDSVAPIAFLSTLREVYPQFAERSRTANVYAQQDAEEAWSQILGIVRQKVKTSEGAEGRGSSFVDRYMSGKFVTVTKCDEEGGEDPVEEKEEFQKLNCHIGMNTNHLRDGLAEAMTETLEKRSEKLGRETTFTKTVKISRLPKYLTVHFVRFFWKRESQKKAKILRKVTFPKELDVVEFCTDELKDMLIPVRDKLREIRKDEEDMERARKRRKKSHESSSTDVAASSSAAKKGGETKGDEKKDSKDKETAGGDTEMTETYKTDAEIEAESDAALLAAKKELHALINQDLLKDEATNHSGLYELRGVVTHQGASADSGHYTAYVKKTAPIDAATGKRGEEDGKWWWFNDDRVSEVPADKIDTLSGGGETHSALILLYKAVPLPSSEGIDE